MYIAPYFLNWMAGKVADQAFRVGAHTGSPGVNGTANELPAGAGRNYQTGANRAELVASEISASGGIADNSNNFVMFTPTAAEAGQLVSHLSYWIGTNFCGWVELIDPERTADAVPFTISAETLAIEFLQFSA